MGEGWSCFLHAEEDMTRGCGGTQEWALLQVAVWAIRKEEQRGNVWRPILEAAA